MHVKPMNRRGFFSLAAAAAALSLLPPEPVIALPKGRKIFLPPRCGWRPDVAHAFDGYFMEVDGSETIELWRLYTDGRQEIVSRTRQPGIQPGDIMTLTLDSNGPRATVRRPTSHNHGIK